MAHDPKAERAAGMYQSQRQRYGFSPSMVEIVKAVPRKPAISSQAVVGLNSPSANPKMVSVGKKMRRKP